MKVVQIPWKSWYGDVQHRLTFPDSWNVKIAAMKDARDIGDRAIKRAFSSPLETKTIQEMAKGRRDAVIVVDDITRPTQAYRLLPLILDELKKGGIEKDRIRLIISLGAHRPMLREDLIKKFGQEIVDTIEIHNHHPYEDLVDLGKSTRGTPIKINKTFIEADLKVSLGCIVPHSYAGFGGGGKNILPGIAGIETLEWNHKPVVSGLSGGIALIEGNETRADIEEIARKAGLEVIVNVVVNSARGIAGIFIGDLVAAHREGVKLAREVYATKIPFIADVVVFNAYPKDTEFIQSINAFNIGLSATKEIVKEGGVIILTTASTEGAGYHSLHGPGARLFTWHDEIPYTQKLFENRKVMIYSPNVSSADIHKFYKREVSLFRRWPDLVRELKRTYIKTCNVVVFPSGTIQLAEA